MGGIFDTPSQYANDRGLPPRQLTEQEKELRRIENENYEKYTIKREKALTDGIKIGNVLLLAKKLKRDDIINIIVYYEHGVPKDRIPLSETQESMKLMENNYKRQPNNDYDKLMEFINQNENELKQMHNVDETKAMSVLGAYRGFDKFQMVEMPAKYSTI